MSIISGTRLGPYEIVDLLAAGGMGEVYRARDTKLGREVALKILPESFTHDPERIARFRREAQVLAALNHPHIGAIYGLDEANGQQFLVLELVDGETLADRLKRGALPLDEALVIAKQIGEALEAAHEKGIIHRDLKPANIAVTKDGNVKVLDFGLAKATEAASGTSVDLANSPTLTSPAAMTAAGIILGTAAYMSPEQAKGRVADKRADIWAFGCVLFEMLAGRRAFDGEDASDILATILKGEPDWAALPAAVPPSVRLLIQRCLEKDRARRVGDLAVVRFVLSDLAGIGGHSLSTTVATPTTSRRRVRSLLPFAVALAAVGLASSMTWWVMRPTPLRVARATISLTGSAALTLGGSWPDLAITPDGSRIVYIGNNRTQLFVRALDQLDPVPLVSGSLRGAPFVSPDGQWVGFFDGDVLKKVAITGGPPIAVCRISAVPVGASWGMDDTIVYATNNISTGLLRVSAGGGESTVLTRPDRQRGEINHVWPEFVPDRQAVLFTIRAGSLDNARIAVFDVRTRTYKTLVAGGSHGRYAPSGHVVYGAAGTLRAVRFDPDRLQVISTPVAVLPELVTTILGGANFDISRDGTLVYVAGGAQAAARTLVWVTRQGREDAIDAPPRAYLYPRLSPDGGRIALDIRDQDSDIWIWHLPHGPLQRLTADPAPDRFPVWTPDGRRVLFASGRVQPTSIFWQAADGTGAAERLTESANETVPMSMSPDGASLVVRESVAQFDLMEFSLGKERRSRPLVRTPFTEQNGEVSPDGRWLAYESNDSGQQFEVYVRPFPDVDSGHWQVSTGGGTQPLWARNAQELFYLTPNGALVSVPVLRSASWQTGAPVKVLETSYYHGAGPGAATGRTYDVSPDGKRFLMIKFAGNSATTPSATVVFNWTEELKRLFPGK